MIFGDENRLTTQGSGMAVMKMKVYGTTTQSDFLSNDIVRFFKLIILLMLIA